MALHVVCYGVCWQVTSWHCLLVIVRFSHSVNEDIYIPVQQLRPSQEGLLQKLLRWTMSGSVVNILFVTTIKYSTCTHLYTPVAPTHMYTPVHTCSTCVLIMHVNCSQFSFPSLCSICTTPKKKLVNLLFYHMSRKRFACTKKIVFYWQIEKKQHFGWLVKLLLRLYYMYYTIICCLSQVIKYTVNMVSRIWIMITYSFHSFILP